MNRKRRKLLKRRQAKRRKWARQKQKEASCIGHEDPFQWGTINVDGEKWISEERAEAEYNFPRELLQCWDELDAVYVPATRQDRRIRRMRILELWSRWSGLNEFPMARRDGDGEIVLHRRLIKDLRFAMDYAGNGERLERAADRDRPGARNKMIRMQLLSLVAYLAQPDGELIRVLFDDFADPEIVGPRQLTEEWDRYAAAEAEEA